MDRSGTHTCYAKQKHLGYKKVWDQLEAAVAHSTKLWYQVKAKKFKI